jgi:2-amino-4-hydroxy-6-hydroxymethyldihydropteridine diphosphokinase
VTTHRYLVALGSNVRHSRHGLPRQVLAAGLRKLDRKGLTLLAASRSARRCDATPMPSRS